MNIVFISLSVGISVITIESDLQVSAAQQETPVVILLVRCLAFQHVT